MQTESKSGKAAILCKNRTSTKLINDNQRIFGGRLEIGYRSLRTMKDHRLRTFKIVAVSNISAMNVEIPFS